MCSEQGEEVVWTECNFTEKCISFLFFWSETYERACKPILLVPNASAVY